MRLSSKLALLVFFSIVLIIIAMSTSFYFFSKSFYKGQLQMDTEHRLNAHREVIESHMVIETFEHVIKMEQRREENSFFIFDKDFNVLYYTHLHSKEMLDYYQKWLADATTTFNRKSEFVETMPQHIPHIWSYEPFRLDGNVVGYLFIDQDTGTFEQARSKLLAITTVMGGITLIFSSILTIYFSKKITLPLKSARNLTKRIAQGDFDVEVTSKGNDEMADLLKQISSMARQLKEYRDTRQQFLTNISHDLRTPLTYIKAYAALLKDQKAEPNVIKDQATVIHQEANRMEGLVHDLFQLMKLEEGNVQMNLQEIELFPFLKEVAKKVKLTAEERGVELLVSSSDPKITSNIDTDQLGRALLNLLNNGIRHTSFSGTIEIRLSQTENETTIEIEDNGEGIPQEDLPFIWDRLYRVDKSRSTSQGGSGLGLAITKQIIELHGGTIHVDSIVNQGTTFVIQLK